MCRGAGALDHALADQLIALIRDAFQTVPLEALKRNKRLVSYLIGFIPEHRRCLVNLAMERMLSLMALGLNTLPVSLEFEPEGRSGGEAVTVGEARYTLSHVQRPSSGLFSSWDARLILTHLAPARGEHKAPVPDAREADDLTDLALQVLAKTSGHQDEVLRQCRSLPLFRGYRCGIGQDFLLSWDLLHQLEQGKSLFIFAAPPNNRGLADIL